MFVRECVGFRIGPFCEGQDYGRASGDGGEAIVTAYGKNLYRKKSGGTIGSVPPE